MRTQVCIPNTNIQCSVYKHVFVVQEQGMWERWADLVGLQASHSSQIPSVGVSDETLSQYLRERERERAQIPTLTSIHHQFTHVHVTHVYTTQTTAIATKRLGIIRTKGTWISRISQTSFKKHSIDNCENYKLILFSFHSPKSSRGHCTRSLSLIRKTDSLNIKWSHHKEWSVLKGLRVKNASCEKILGCFL